MRSQSNFSHGWVDLTEDLIPSHYTVGHCLLVEIIKIEVWLTRCVGVDGLTRISLARKKTFILCKPHRARAQPRSDLGRNRAVTVGIERKKKRNFSWPNNWLNFHIFFQEPMTAIWAITLLNIQKVKTTHTISILDDSKTTSDSRDFSLQELTIIPETGVRTTAQKLQIL